MPDSSWTRRTFVSTLGSLTALATIPAIMPRAAAAALNPSLASSRKFAFTASAAGAVHVYKISRSGAWTLTQTVTSSAPSALVLSPDHRFLYLANAVKSFAHRPTGSVEAYAIDAETGHLSLLDRHPLALFATMPKHLAISPNGRLLAVTVEGGAAYNLLKLGPDGKIDAVTASLKPIGRTLNETTAQTSNPQTVFSTNGNILATSATHRNLLSLSIDKHFALAIDDRHGDVQIDATHIVASPTPGIYFTAGSNPSVISSISYDPDATIPLRILQDFELPATPTALAMSSTRRLLFAATSNGISAIEINRGTLQSSPLPSYTLPHVNTLTPSPDGRHLFAVTHSGSILQIDVDHQGVLSAASEVAAIASPTAFALKYS